MVKEKTSPPAQEEEHESYLSYVIHKLVIIVKDGGTVNIDKLMSGEPKNPLPPHRP